MSCTPSRVRPIVFEWYELEKLIASKAQGSCIVRFWYLECPQQAGRHQDPSCTMSQDNFQNQNTTFSFPSQDAAWSDTSSDTHNEWGNLLDLHEIILLFFFSCVVKQNKSHRYYGSIVAKWRFTTFYVASAQTKGNPGTSLLLSWLDLFFLYSCHNNNNNAPSHFLFSQCLDPWRTRSHLTLNHSQARRHSTVRW